MTEKCIKKLNVNNEELFLHAVGVIDQNNTSNAIKTWTGTKAEYDAIVTKDANTQYTTTDETDSSTSYTTTELSAMGMPDWDRYEILTVGPSAESYFAPANGWFFANGKVSGNNTGNINLRLADTTNYMARMISWATGNVLSIYFPAKQGDEIVFSYSTSVENLALFFVYAKGNPGGN